MLLQNPEIFVRFRPKTALIKHAALKVSDSKKQTTAKRFSVPAAGRKFGGLEESSKRTNQSQGKLCDLAYVISKTNFCFHPTAVRPSTGGERTKVQDKLKAKSTQSFVHNCESLAVCNACRDFTFDIMKPSIASQRPTTVQVMMASVSGPRGLIGSKSCHSMDICERCSDSVKVTARNRSESEMSCQSVEICDRCTDQHKSGAKKQAQMTSSSDDSLDDISMRASNRPASARPANSKPSGRKLVASRSILDVRKQLIVDTSCDSISVCRDCAASQGKLRKSRPSSASSSKKRIEPETSCDSFNICRNCAKNKVDHQISCESLEICSDCAARKSSCESFNFCRQCSSKFAVKSCDSIGICEDCTNRAELTDSTYATSTVSKQRSDDDSSCVSFRVCRNCAKNKSKLAITSCDSLDICDSCKSLHIDTAPSLNTCNSDEVSDCKSMDICKDCREMDESCHSLNVCKKCRDLQDSDLSCDSADICDDCNNARDLKSDDEVNKSVTGKYKLVFTSLRHLKIIPINFRTRRKRSRDPTTFVGNNAYSPTKAQTT